MKALLVLMVIGVSINLQAAARYVSGSSCSQTCKFCISDKQTNKEVCSAPYTDSDSLNQRTHNLNSAFHQELIQLKELPAEGFNAATFFANVTPQMCQGSSKKQEFLKRDLEALKELDSDSCTKSQTSGSAATKK